MKKRIGHFTSMEQIMPALENILYTAALPNYVSKFTLDLSEARNRRPLSNIGGGERLFRRAHWYYLKVLIKGGGQWTLIFKLPNGEVVTLTESEIIKGDSIYLEWIELQATNTAQPGETNPVFWCERRDIAEI